MLWCKSELNRQDGDARLAREASAHSIVCFKVANSPTSAVQIDKKWSIAGSGSIEPSSQSTDPKVAQFVHLRPAGTMPTPFVGATAKSGHIEVEW